VRASYLASPPLCVVYALAGSVQIDLTTEPLGRGADGPVFLSDIWPSADDVAQAIRTSLEPQQFEHEYGRVWDGDENWAALPSPSGPMYEWDPDSTYVREPPFFDDLDDAVAGGNIEGARVLVKVGDSITTDHISPAGSIKADSPAGEFLKARGVSPAEFNSYGARRGNHEVMMRGTFANIRLRNEMAPGTEGPWTTYLPDGDLMTVFDAAGRYREAGVPLAVLAGKEYGSGSSRDWAAKGPSLLGVRFVIAESYERIHRSNLVGMGVLPLQFAAGESAVSLGLSGRETISVRGLEGGVSPGMQVAVEAVSDDGARRAFSAIVRIDGAAEVDYFAGGGLLRMVLRELLER
jgi:aconitate hydratase